MNQPAIRNITRACALCGSLLFASTLSAGFFVRPSLLYVGYTAPGFSAEAGGSVAAGVTRGALQQHEWSVEVASASWSWDHQPFPTAPWYTQTGDGQFTPVLAHYRHYWGPAEARARLYAGASAGVAKISGDVMVVGSGILLLGSPNQTEAAFGATVGVTGKITPTLSYDFGYRYLEVGGFDVPSKFGGLIHFPKTSAHLFAAGLKVQF